MTYIRIMIGVLALLMPSCALHLTNNTNKLVVCYHKKEAYLNGKKMDVTVSQKGIGGTPGSNKTPTGELKVIDKTTKHRYGTILRLGGYSDDRLRQDDRGILIHKKYGMYTHGCIGMDPKDLQFVYASLDINDVICIIP